VILNDGTESKLDRKRDLEFNPTKRQLNLLQRVEMDYTLEGLEKEIAKRRMSLGGHIVLVGLAKKREL